MKIFLQKILVFAILLFAIGYVTDECITRGLHQTKYRDFASWNEIFHQSINANVIVQGTSRAKVHIHPLILDSILNTNTYNLGINGNDINLQVCKYKIYLKNNNKPQYIIQNVDIETLKFQKNIRENLQFLPYISDTTLSNTLKSYNSITWADQYLPLFKYRGRYEISNIGFSEFLDVAINDTTSLNIKGFTPQYRTWDGDSLPPMMNIEINKKALATFENFLQQCQRENIFVVLVHTPYYHTFHYDKNLNQIFGSLAQRYKGAFLDYSTIALCKDSTNFYNVTHLNAKGAEQFSILLANDLKNILVRQ